MKPHYLFTWIRVDGRAVTGKMNSQGVLFGLIVLLFPKKIAGAGG